MEPTAHGPKVAETPTADRPREQLLLHGPGALRTAELLAILIRSGRPGESAPHAGEKLAAHFADQLDRLAEAGRGELKDIAAAIGKVAYCQIMAGIELGRRVAQAQEQRRRPASRILSSADAIAFCTARFARLASDAIQEEFHIVCLDTKHHLIATHRVSLGSLDRTIVHPRDVFRPAIKDAAKAVLLVHNHPSGDPTPSRDDISLTRRLEEAAEILGVQVLDHIIVGRHGTVSLRQAQA
jgi:DNA repair protein RadC